MRLDVGLEQRVEVKWPERQALQRNNCVDYAFSYQTVGSCRSAASFKVLCVHHSLLARNAG